MHKISLLNYLRLVCKSEYTRMLGDECPRSLVKRCSFTVQIYLQALNLCTLVQPLEGKII